MPHHRVTDHHPQQPQEYQYGGNHPEHRILLSIGHGSGTSVANRQRSASLLALGLLDGHRVFHSPHAGNVARELGDWVLFSGVPAISTQRSHVSVRRDLGRVDTDRVMV